MHSGARSHVIGLLLLVPAVVLAQLRRVEPPAPPDMSGLAKQTVNCTLHDASDPSRCTQWTITRPEVRQRITEYRDIVFQSGETVTVRAGGCVNTGGKGNSWKHYVDPSGNDTDRLYHGLIWIPGARIIHNGEKLVTPVAAGLIRMSGIVGGLSPASGPKPVELLIDSPPDGVAPFLRLGYEDDHYADNGYTGKESGNRCDKDKLGEAKVVITIQQQHPSDGRRPPVLSFDPVSKKTDPNGFLLAPQWAGNYNSIIGEQREALRDCHNFPYRDGVFVHKGIQSRCTRQASFDVPPTWTQCLLEPGLGELHGHVNWAAATYLGEISFEDFSADNDLDFQLYDFTERAKRQRLGSYDAGGSIHPILTEDSQGAGSEYKDALHLEFAGYEATEHFTAGGWDVFHYFAFQDTPGQSRDTYDANLTRQFYRKTAVVSGLLGLDCVHECHTELHPVYAIAIRTKYECLKIGYENRDRQETNPSAPGDCEVQGTGAELNPAILPDDVWMIFVRNSGNEGSCGRDEHYLDRDAITLVLPAPPGATQAPVIGKRTAFLANQEGLRWSWVELPHDPTERPKGVAITFSLMPSSCDPVLRGEPIRLHGALHLNWSGRDCGEDCGPIFDFIPEDSQPKHKHNNPDPIARRTKNPGSLAPDVECVIWSDGRIRPRACQIRGDQIVHFASKYDSQQEAFAQERDTRGRADFLTKLKLVGTYWYANFGVFGELPYFVNTGGFTLGPGGRTELLQTLLSGENCMRLA